MLDYWLTKELLQAAGIGFLLLALIGIGLALWLPKKWWRKLLAVLAVGFVIAIPIYKAIQDNHRQQVVVDDYKERLAKAQALFDERCKTAGEKIFKTEESVEGIAWMKWRPKTLNHDQFALDDPYGKDCSAEGCILRLLRGSEAFSTGPEPNAKSLLAYKFVETTDPTDGVRYRYRGVSKSITEVSKEEFSQHVQRTGSGADSNGRFLALERDPINEFSARFGLTWEDISTPADREYWIAGGSLKVIDLQTDKVIAERLGYLIDTGQGNTAGSRDPWGWAQSYAPKCPQQPRNTLNFVTRVLQPAK